MNVYQLHFGNIKHYVAAEDEQDAYAQGTDPELFPDLHFRPFQIEQVEIEGFTISVTENASSEQPKNKGGRPKKVAV